MTPATVAPPPVERPAREALSGLEPWQLAELPEPPNPKGLGWFGALGPGVIILGAAIGSGEFLLGPATFLRYGMTLLCFAMIAIFFQTVFNMEAVRYTLATGEPAYTGFMRTSPHPTFWAWFYAALCFLQLGWPAWAATAAGAVFFLGAGELPTAADANTVYLIGVVAFLVCVVVLAIGRRIEHTLELLNWVLVATVLAALLVMAVVFVAPETWVRGLAGFAAFDTRTRTFHLFPSGADWFLIGAFVAYSGSGGIANITVSNWARDKGYGMGRLAGYIPCAVGGKKIHLAHCGFTFDPDADSLRRWRGWWRIVAMDQWGVFFWGAMVGMLLPALLYVTFLPEGTEIRGLGIAAALATAIETRVGAAAGLAVAFMAAWILVKTQLDNLEAMVRALTDILWTGSSRVRAWRGGDVRLVYYSALLAAVVWGMVALRLVQPVFLLQLGANIAAIVMMIASLHILYVNTKLLPVALRPPLWRRAALVAMSLFYGAFVTLWLGTLL